MLHFLRRTVQRDDFTHLGSKVKDTCKLVMDENADQEATGDPKVGCKLSEVGKLRCSAGA